MLLYDWQDQYYNISDQTQKGIDFCEKFSHFVKERCAIENDYAGKLRSVVIAAVYAVTHVALSGKQTDVCI